MVMVVMMVIGDDGNRLSDAGVLGVGADNAFSSHPI